MNFQQYLKLRNLKYSQILKAIKDRKSKENQEVKTRKTKPLIIPQTKINKDEKEK